LDGYISLGPLSGSVSSGPSLAAHATQDVDPLDWSFSGQAFLNNPFGGIAVTRGRESHG
jgi:hypothetical protein